MVGGGYVRLRNDGIAEYIIGDTETMRDLIKKIEPYLVLKKRQARLLIEILDCKRGVKNEDDFLRMAQLIDQYKDLNYSKKRSVGFAQVKNELEKDLTP